MDQLRKTDPSGGSLGRRPARSHEAVTVRVVEVLELDFDGASLDVHRHIPDAGHAVRNEQPEAAADAILTVISDDG